MSDTIDQAVILAAGLGSRLRKNDSDYLKPLYPLFGKPLVAYVMDALAQIGVKRFFVVVGFEKQELIPGLQDALPRETSLEFIDNPDFHLSNGISLLKAAKIVKGRFILSMCDHLYRHTMVRRLVHGASNKDFLYLAVDRKLSSIFDMDDATKVRTEGDKIIDINKKLKKYDAIDTGLFVCPETIFEHLADVSRTQGGDCSLSDGVRTMAETGRSRIVDIGDAFWQDVDTPEMFEHAERWLVKNSPIEISGLGMSPAVDASNDQGGTR